MLLRLATTALLHSIISSQLLLKHYIFYTIIHIPIMLTLCQRKYSNYILIIIAIILHICIYTAAGLCVLYFQSSTPHTAAVFHFCSSTAISKNTQREERESQQQQEESREFMKSQNQLHHLWFTPSFAKLFLK